MSFPKTTAPLIELHGYSEKEAQEQLKQLKQDLKAVLDDKDYGNLVFSISKDLVQDVEGNNRPFIRFYSTEWDIVHKIIEHLRKNSWNGELEFIKITQFHDLRN